MLASLAGIHTGFAWVVIVGNGLAGAWALGAARWASFQTRALWWFTAGAQVSAFVQVVLGVAMVAGKDVPDLHFHMLYGFSTIIAVGIIYSYRQQLRHRIYLLYGFGGLFIMGLGLRALEIGPR